jgi:protein TonB
MDVTDVLRGRMQTPAGLQKMLSLSIGVHLALAAFVIVTRGGFLNRHDVPPTLMTISLSGSAGPDNGGMTALGGRPVQAVTPPEDVAKREASRAPAAKTPEMTVPLPNAKTVKTTPAPTVKQAPDEARGRTPTKGAQPAFGSAIADTGVRGQGFGLSTGGGVGTGSSLEITGDFCCPEYLAIMITRIRSAWNQNQGGARGTSLIRFTIQRDGTITTPTIFQQSGTTTLDTAALRAVLATRMLPPLPEAYTNPTLTMRLSFIYQ